MEDWSYSFRMKPRYATDVLTPTSLTRFQGVAEAIKNSAYSTLKIPCWSDQVESLNVAVAGSILMYDLKRANG